MFDAIYNLQNKFQRIPFDRHTSKHFFEDFYDIFHIFYIPAKRFLENIPHVSLTSHLTKHLHHKTIKRENFARCRKYNSAHDDSLRWQSGSDEFCI